MRFRANLENSKTLSKLVTLLSKINSQINLRLSPSLIYFSSADSIQVFAQIDVSLFFSDMICESLNNNLISIQIVNSSHLIQALSSCSDSESSLKLSKVNNLPVLLFSILQQNDTGRSVTVSQKVPIRVISPDQMISEPEYPLASVHISLPPLQSLLNILDKIKHVSPIINISANMSGNLKLHANTDLVDVSTVFNNLSHPELDPMQLDVENHPSNKRDCGVFAHASVDLKKLSSFCQVNVLSPSNCVLCIVEGVCLNLYVYLGENGDGGCLTYFIPVRL